jgi:hypothetical protein
VPEDKHADADAVLPGAVSGGERPREELGGHRRSADIHRRLRLVARGGC